MPHTPRYLPKPILNRKLQCVKTVRQFDFFIEPAGFIYSNFATIHCQSALALRAALDAKHRFGQKHRVPTRLFNRKQRYAEKGSETQSNKCSKDKKRNRRNSRAEPLGSQVPPISMNAESSMGIPHAVVSVHAPLLLKPPENHAPLFGLDFKHAKKPYKKSPRIHPGRKDGLKRTFFIPRNRRLRNLKDVGNLTEGRAPRFTKRAQRRPDLLHSRRAVFSFHYISLLSNSDFNKISLGFAPSAGPTIPFDSSRSKSRAARA